MNPVDRSKQVTDEGDRRSGAREPEHRRFVRFVLAAGASVPVNLAARIILSQWLEYGVAVLLAHGVGMVTAFTLTRIFVFERSGRSIRGELGRFAIVNLFSGATTWAISVSLVGYVFPAIGFHTQPELIGHIIGLGVASVTSFIGHRRFSFGRIR